MIRQCEGNKMADALLAITTEYVKCFLVLVGKDICWPEFVLQQLRLHGLDPLDVTYVIAHGEVVATEKEDAYGTNFWMTGKTCDDASIRVEFRIEPDETTLRIRNVERI